MILARVTLLLNAAILGVLGAWILIQPARLHDWIGLDVSSPAARVEFRAFYGGLELGLAGFLIWTLSEARRLETGCACVAWVLLCTAAARGVGLVLERSLDPRFAAYLAVEGLMGLSGLAAWLWLRRTST